MVKALPRKLRDPFLLAASGDHRYEEIATLLGIPIGTVKWRISEARRMIRDSGRHVGEVLAAAVNLLNPAVLVVAGDMAGAYDIFVAGLRESLYSQASALATRELVIAPVTHGDQSGVVGCAALAIREVLDSAAVEKALQGKG